jgi:hypothetical protein
MEQAGMAANRMRTSIPNGGELPDGSRRLVPCKAPARSRVSNGAGILPDVDGRSAVARRYRDIAGQIIADMGGASHCAEARLQLIRRFAAAAVLAEQMEARLANGYSINITDHALLSSTLVRLAQRIGIDRRSRNITRSLSEYLDLKSKRIDAEAAQ